MPATSSTAGGKPARAKDKGGTLANQKTGDLLRTTADLHSQSTTSRSLIADLNQRTIADLLLASLTADLHHGIIGDNHVSVPRMTSR